MSPAAGFVPSPATTCIAECVDAAGRPVSDGTASARGADVTVAADASLDETALAATVEQSLRQAGVTQPNVTISHAQAIARDPRTGKVRRGRNTAETGRGCEDSQFSAR